MDCKNNYQQIAISHGQKLVCHPFQTLPSYDKIIELAKTSFPNASSHSIYYVDDEGDQVSVRSDMELTEAYRLAEHQGKRDVRLYLERVEEVSKGLPEINNSVTSPRPELVHSIPPPLRPELSSSSFQRSTTDYGRSQVFDFRTAEESEILVKIQSKLSEMTSVVGHLARAKQEQTEKMKHNSEFENEISDLKMENNQLTQSLDETLLKNNNLKMELSTQIQKNGDLSEQFIQMQESFKLQLKEQEDTINRISKEKEMFHEALKQKSTVLANQESSMSILKETLTKMGRELRKEKECKSELESKVDLLTKELDSKTGEYLEMSRRVIDVQAQKESLTKKATNLERQLEEEHQERESLQQSLVQLQLQGSITAGKIPFPIESRDNSDPSGIFVFKSDDKWPKEKVPPEQTLLDAQRWGNEPGVHNSSGFPATQDDTNIPPKQNLPKDISESDMQLLEAMGFVDLDKNIGLLRSNNYDISVVVETLLKQEI